jgi:hypothetical protein
VIARGVALAALLSMACKHQGTEPPVDATVLDGAPVDCPNDLPRTCPMPAPTWSGTVQSIVQIECASCHSAGGDAPTLLLDTYQRVFDHRVAVLDQTYACWMPPANGGMLSPTERAALLGWLVCGALNN